MTVAIMQPYFLPYLGYFQLMAAADRFVILDDVNYINRGWINRNRLWLGGVTSWLTIPLVGASQNRLIHELDIKPDDGWKRAMERNVSLNYAKAPYAAEVLPMVDRWLADATGNLSAFLFRVLMELSAWLDLNVSILPSSAIYTKGDLKGQQRILDICLREGADIYLNPPGGKELYDEATFASADISLRFLKPQIHGLDLAYGGEEGPVLSILDLMMMNSQASLRHAVRAFHIETAEPLTSPQASIT